jgi:hypothetical protein
MTSTLDISVDDPGSYAFDRLYQKLQEVANDGITSSNITGIVLTLMQSVQTLGNLNGPQKKELVIDVVKKFIREKVDDENVKRDLQIFADLTLPPLIDEFVALNNRETRIKFKNCISKIINRCLRCCKLSN